MGSRHSLRWNPRQGVWCPNRFSFFRDYNRESH
ncbi:hypothetical protein SeF3a_223 [Salmonella phage SeF3a]|nr:hypothetical protein SeF3a_223 [Salmonella phage SeF3a]